MKKVLVPLAPGFEEIEAITVIDILRRAGVEVTVAGTQSGPIEASRQTKHIPDCTPADVRTEDFDMLVLPGGQPGAYPSPPRRSPQANHRSVAGEELLPRSHLRRADRSLGLRHLERSFRHQPSHRPHRGRGGRERGFQSTRHRRWPHHHQSDCRYRDGVRLQTRGDPLRHEQSHGSQPWRPRPTLKISAMLQFPTQTVESPPVAG